MDGILAKGIRKRSLKRAAGIPADLTLHGKKYNVESCSNYTDKFPEFLASR